jgi:DNA-binding transcriptional ArsR family regulator
MLTYAYMNTQRFPLTDAMIESVARRFRVLGEPQRLRILQILKRGPQTVTQVAAALGLSQPNVSRHLQSLYDAGALGRRREGNTIFYSVSDPVMFKLCDLVCDSVIGRTHAQLRDMAPRAARPLRGKGRRTR